MLEKIKADYKSIKEFNPHWDTNEIIDELKQFYKYEPDYQDYLDLIDDYYDELTSLP